MYFSPKTSADGLVFHYDTGNTVRSYLGEPTVNLISNPIVGDYGNAPGSSTNTVSPDGTNNATIPIPNAAADRYQETVEGGLYSSGTQFTYSWHYKQLATHTGITPNEPGGLYILGLVNCSLVGSVTKIKDLSNGWSRWKATFQITDGSLQSIFRLYFGYVVGVDQSSAAYYGHQFEQKSYATPFVAGTRSATQGLKDLTGSKTISLSTVSFDANAQMTFDGTDDTLDTGIPLTALPALSNFTIECLIKIDAYPTAAPANGYGSTTRCGVLIGAAYYSGTALYWYGNSSGTACTIYAYIRGADAYRTAGEFNLTPGRYHHLVLVNDYSGGTIKLYANGTLNGSANTATQEYNPSLAPSAGNIGISKAQIDGGGTAVYSYLPCQVPSVKIFNRALTADEVARNFNAIKSRFNVG